MCIVAALMATSSTAIYGLSNGFLPLFLARIVWGIAYAILVLSTLAYAIQYRAKAGTRVGTSQAIQRLGPILSLLLGTWLVTQVGPSKVFILLAIPTSLGIIIGLYLPKHETPNKKVEKTKHKIAKPTLLDILFFLQGYGVDGLFAVTVTLMLAKTNDFNIAILGGGTLLALRHFGEAIAAPIFGYIADIIGAKKIFLISALLTVSGLLLISQDYIIIGAIILLIFRGALAALGPAIIAQSEVSEENILGNLARMQTWRDLGAALGPVITGSTLLLVSAELQHLILAIIFTSFLVLFKRSKSF
jgi:MFS family permease|tara:strand:- start:500 stop:1408 length:909 start_codon:yes stop_codon:yes gene_type:complete